MKKIKIISTIIIFLLSILCHFMYVWSPNTLFSILLPVNESIWEHMKLIITPVLITSIFEYIIYNKKNIKYNNFIFSYAISIFIGIIAYLIIYIPINDIFGHNAFIAIFLLFIIFILIEIISYYIIKTNIIRYSNIIGIFLIIFMYIVFGYLTYKPIHINLFYDYANGHYGIKKEYCYSFISSCHNPCLLQYEYSFPFFTLSKVTFDSSPGFK